jgi:ATP-binding cassette subfamily B protein
MNLISSSVTIMAIIITLFTIDPFVALTAFLGFGVLYAGIILLVKKQLAMNSVVLSREYPQMVKALQEGLGGIRDVLIDGTQETYGKIFNRAQSRYNESSANNQIVGNSPRLIVEFLGIMFICIIAYQLVLKGDGFMAAIPVLAALALGAQRLLPALQNFYYNVETDKTKEAISNLVLTTLRAEIGLTNLEELLAKIKDINRRLLYYKRINRWCH